MTIEAHNDTETTAVFQRERAGEFRILRMERGGTNAAWTFTVSEPTTQPELLPLAATHNAPHARSDAAAPPGGHLTKALIEHKACWDGKRPGFVYDSKF
jgi:hypothetical protein